MAAAAAGRSDLGTPTGDPEITRALSALAELGLAPDDPLAALDHRGQLARRVLISLRGLNGAEAQARVRMGEGLRRLTREFSIDHLGSTKEAFAEGRLNVSWKTCRQWMTLAEKLPNLPVLQSAYFQGAIPFARMRLLVTAASAETDAAWAQAGRGMSTRAIQRAIKAGKPETSVDEDAPARTEQITWRAKAPDAGAFLGFGLEMLRAVHGARLPTGTLVEALAAEVISSLGPQDADDDDVHAAPVDGACDQESCCGPRPSMKTPRRRPSPTGRPLNGRRLARLAQKSRRWSHVPPRLLELPDMTIPTNAWELLRCIQKANRLCNAIEHERAYLLELVKKRSLHEAMGFEKLDHFHEALGIAPGHAGWLVALASCVRRGRELREDWRAGRISARLLDLVRDFAIPHAAQWSRYLQEATFKRIELEADYIKRFRISRPLCEADAHVAQGTPLRHLALRDLVVDWPAELCRIAAMAEARPAGGDAPTGAATAPMGSRASCRHGFMAGEEDADRGQGQGCVPAAPLTLVPDPGEPLQSADGKRRDEGCVPLRCPHPHPFPWVQLLLPTSPTVRMAFRCTAHGASLFREALGLVRQHERSDDDGWCVTWMLHHFASIHASPEIMKAMMKHVILERDRWLCQAPHCKRMATLHVHHRIFRSALGTDDDWNLVSLCERCHALVHAGRMVILGRAPDQLRFLVGISPGRDPREERYEQDVRKPKRAMPRAA